MKIQLREYQRNAVEAIEGALVFGAHNVILHAETSYGKEQPYSEPVLTPDGWKTIGELKINDYVIGSNGKPTRVTNIYEQGEKDVYNINFLDKTSVRCGIDHLWTYHQKMNRVIDGKRTSVLVKHTDSVKSMLKKKTALKQKRLYIDLVKPVEFVQQKQELPIDPYIFGLLLGDGSFRNRKISFSNNKIDIRNCLEENLHDDDIFCNHSQEGNKYDVSIKSKFNQKSNLYKEIEKLGLAEHYSYEKFIPEIYLKSSIENRKKLLQGLIDTDGHISHKTSNEYSTSSERLANDVLELSRSLGILANYSTRVPTYSHDGEKKKGRQSWRIFFRWSRQYKTISSIKKLDYKENSRCITVDAEDHLYVTRDYTLTHNSITAAGICEKFHDKHIVILVNIEPLIDQIAFFLKEMGIDYSILKAGRESEFDTNARVQLVMSQTFYARYEDLKIKADLLIQDEVHKEYATPRTRRIMNSLVPDARIGLSATPWDESGFALHDSEIISTITCQELTEQGYLAPIKYYVPRWAEKVSYASVKKSGAEYSMASLDEVIGSNKHIKHTIKAMNECNAKKRKTLVFCSTIEQCDRMETALIEAGYNAAAYHSNKSKSENKRIMQSFKYNKPFSGSDKDLEGKNLFDEDVNKAPGKVVTCLLSVSKLTTGFSVDDIDLGVNARPTKIKSLWHQIAGRLRRTSYSLDNILKKHEDKIEYNK